MAAPASDALERARRVRLMLFDVDGILTDGTLWYGPGGEALKGFNALDGHGLKMLAGSGVRVGILSGRSSPAVSARAAELEIDIVFQGVSDKRARYEALLAELGMPSESTGYMADDVVDLPVLVRCGFACTVREAPEPVRSRAHYVCSAAAGRGAAREACEYLMRAQGTLAPALEAYTR